MTIKEMKELALCAAKNEAPANYSMENVNDALVEGLRELAGSVNQFMKNRYDIYEIIIEAADEVVPNKVIDAIGIFAEVRQVGQGQKALFRQRLGKARARKFLTQVGLSGVYETFRLDNATFEVAAHAIGGACANGTIALGTSAPVKGPVLKVVEKTTMPDGTLGVKFQVLTA